MNNLNSILIEGNLTRDPQTRTIPNGMPVCTFSIASNRFYKKGESFEKEVSFFDIECWSKLAEKCASQGCKGKGVRIVGRLKQERWMDAESKQRSRAVIVAEHVEFRPNFRKQEEAEQSEEDVPEEVSEAIPF